MVIPGCGVKGDGSDICGETFTCRGCLTGAKAAEIGQALEEAKRELVVLEQKTMILTADRTRLLVACKAIRREGWNSRTAAIVCEAIFQAEENWKNLAEDPRSKK